MNDTGIVLHQGAIGDFVLSLPIVQALRAARPVSRVVAIASAPSARLAAGRSVIDACISPDAIGVHTLFAAAGGIDDRLGSALGRAHWVLSFLGDALSRPGVALAQIPAHQFLSRIDPRPRAETLSRRQHMTSQWACDVAAHGIPLGEIRPAQITMKVGEIAGSAAQGGREIMLHPGSGGREKCWPFERFVAIAERLLRQGDRVSWLLGPAEAERFPDWVETLRRRVRRGEVMPVERLVVEDDIVRAAEQIAGIDFYLGNDAGLTHVAAALGVPTIAVFGPTDPEVWRPPNPNVRGVAPAEPVSIDAISVETVWSALAEASRPLDR